MAIKMSLALLLLLAFLIGWRYDRQTGGLFAFLVSGGVLGSTNSCNCHLVMPCHEVFIVLLYFVLVFVAAMKLSCDNPLIFFVHLQLSLHYHVVFVMFCVHVFVFYHGLSCDSHVISYCMNLFYMYKNVHAVIVIYTTT